MSGFLDRLQVINDNKTVNLVILILLSALNGSILIISCVLAGDIYGAGPAFVSVTNGLGLVAFAVWLW